MADGTQPSVLRRKAEAGRTLSGGGVLTPVRALGQSFARAADDLMGLSVTIVECRETRVSLAELPERIEERSLLAVLEGPGDALGLLVLAPDMLSTLIEMQTTGRISNAEPTRRRPTRTDAALSVHFVNAVLSLFENQLAADPAVIWAGGFRFASVVDDPRPLGLMFEDCIYRAMPLVIDCGTDPLRRCTALLVLPADGSGPAPIRDPGSSADDRNSDDGLNGEADWVARMDHAVMGARAPVEAVLERVSLPFSTVVAFKSGDLVPLSKNALSKLRVEGHGRRLLTHGKLGQAQGHLAVRLHLAERDGTMSDDDLAAGEQALLASAEGTEGAGNDRSTRPTDPMMDASRPVRDITPADSRRAESL